MQGCWIGAGLRGWRHSAYRTSFLRHENRTRRQFKREYSRRKKEEQNAADLEILKRELFATVEARVNFGAFGRDFEHGSFPDPLLEQGLRKCARLGRRPPQKLGKQGRDDVVEQPGEWPAKLVTLH